MYSECVAFLSISITVESSGTKCQNMDKPIGKKPV